MKMSREEKEGMANLDRLVSAIDKAYHHPGPLVWRGFLVGLASGLGATIGVALVLALLGFILRELGGLPIVGEWLQGVGNNLNRF
jgi:hypothetical protein